MEGVYVLHSKALFMITLKIVSVIILIALTAFFVASEFAIVKVRPSRINEMVASGEKRAIPVKQLISHLDGYLSACQLGITVTALGLGWIGEPTMQVLLTPVFTWLHVPPSILPIISFIVAFSVITFLHVVIGELAPKTIAIQKAEEIALFVAKPLILFYRIMYPFIWILNGSARWIAKVIGFQPVSETEIAHSEEELRIILSESFKSGEINQSEYRYVNRVFEFDNKIAKEVMVPRLEIVSLHKHASINEVMDIIKQEKFTRYPVIEGDKDNIIGIVNIKEFLADCISNNCNEEKPLLPYIKPTITVLETIPIQSLLVKMQRERNHMAILLDEYGGTAGLVTVEDIIEEIFGEIRDEFDTDEIPYVQKINGEHYILDAKILIEDVNQLLGTSLAAEDVDTLGGWLFSQTYDLQQGDILECDSYRFKVREMQGTHILFVEAKKIDEQS